MASKKGAGDTNNEWPECVAKKSVNRRQIGRDIDGDEGEKERKEGKTEINRGRAI